MSPVIQNAAFRSTRIKAVYIPFCVNKSDLRRSIDALRALGIRGFNVTAPHKVEVCRYLDKLDRLAKEIGSVNTVAANGKLFCGYNTDGIGALRTLEEAGAQLDGSSVLLLGAGGASRALAYSFASNARTIRIVNRTVLKARQLQHRLQKRFKLDITVASLAGESIKQFVEDADIIVNATSMGQNGRFDPPIRKNWFHQGQFVLDLVYRPVETVLLKVARSAGATAVNGLRMLVNQGACSFEIWTSRSAPVAVMHKAARQEGPM